MRQEKFVKKTSGQVLLIIVVLFIFLLAGLEAAILLYMHNHHRLNVKQVTLTDDFYYASAGVERAIWKLKEDVNYLGETYAIPGTNVPIDITVVPLPLNQRRINSYVFQLKSGGELTIARHIQAVVERSEEVDGGTTITQVSLINWQEILPTKL